MKELFFIIIAIVIGFAILSDKEKSSQPSQQNNIIAPPEPVLRSAKDADCLDVNTDKYVNANITFPQNSPYNDWACWDFYLPKGYIGVVTVVPQTQNIDPDVLVKEYNTNAASNIKISKNKGFKKELVTFNSEKSDWFNVTIRNYSGNYGNTKITVHRVNVEKIFAEGLVNAGIQYLAEELICAIFTDQPCSDSSKADQQMLGRAVTYGLSELQDQNLDQMTRTMIINEAVSSIQNDLNLPREMAIVASNITSTMLEAILIYY